MSNKHDQEALGGVDEGDFLELLIANERISEWVDQLETPGSITSPARKREIIMQMADLVDSRVSYAEEARRANVVPILTRVLSSTTDEALMEAISRIMVACSGPIASGGKVSTYTYGPGVSVRIKEGALGDGLGARVWTVAHILCKELVVHAGFVRGQRVLEIGAGCGVCGVVAAKLEAAEVVLTDVEGPVLRNLRDCVRLNQTGDEQRQQASTSRCDGDDDCGGARQQQEEPVDKGAAEAWSCGAMHVRQLDWLESLSLMRRRGHERAAGAGGQPQGGAGEMAASGQLDAAAGGEEGGAGVEALQHDEPLDAKTFYKDDLLRMADDRTLPGELPPQVPLDVAFERIIGTDIMYEPSHATLVAAVLAHRLAPGGAALLCCAVRQARTFATFRTECARWGLRFHQRQVQPLAEYEGILGREEDYEGGFLLMAVDHAAAPCLAWYQEDWDAVA